MAEKPIKFVYFGGEPIGVPVLEELKATDLLPELVVCNPDRPVGRKQVLTPPPVKVWAEANGIEVLQPETIPKSPSDLDRLTSEDWDVFVVVAYNTILPKWFIDLPTHGTVNVHPSLLPKLRGASPIRTTILNDMRDECGVSVMLLDEKMDHGPILAQHQMNIARENWPVSGPDLDEALGHLGGAVLSNVLPHYVAGEVLPQEQNHNDATYCGRIDKGMAELGLDPQHLPEGEAAHQAWLKINAFAGWPGTFFIHEGKRYKITAARLEGARLVIDKVIPEGKSETDWINVF